MAEARSRLIRCFAAAFPTLNEGQIIQADAETLTVWDSVASVTLFATIEEEFETEIELEDMTDLLSFSKILTYLQTKGLGS
jgi:acyl carrier protein